MKKQEYLYGDVEVCTIPEDVIMRRVEALKDHLDELLKIDYSARDFNRVNNIVKAISFWENINEN